ncbi:MAG: ABC transporter ATP-binding protein [Geminicoccaceae bacterium]
MTEGLRLQGVAKDYGAARVLHPLDLEAGPREFLTILGPSGSGKTTILRLVGGFTEVSAGRITIDGEDVTDLPINRRPCHTVFQDYALFPHMTVAENVGYGLMVRGTGRDEIRRRVAAVLDIVGLATFAERRPSQLSGGQRQRTALARAIVLEPKLVLLDEPLAALDAELRRQMQGFLKDLQRRLRTCFLFVTHDQEEAITMADRIVVMRHGLIEQVGTPREIYWRPRTAFVAGFFGDNNLIPVTLAGHDGDAVLVDGPLGRFRLPGPAPADNLLLALRPESLEIGEGDPAISGEVADLVFTGAVSTLLVAVPGLATPLRVQLKSRPEGEGFEPGTRVHLRFAPADAALVPA